MGKSRLAVTLEVFGRDIWKFRKETLSIGQRRGGVICHILCAEGLHSTRSLSNVREENMMMWPGEDNESKYRRIIQIRE